MEANILLIGPMGAGKGTLAALLAERLGRQRVELDELRWAYFAEIGFDQAVQRDIGEREGIAGVLRYWQPFEVHAVERVLADYAGTVIDFGGGYTIQSDPTLRTRVRRALAGQPLVFLLLPSPDLDETVRILRERTAGQAPDDFDFATHAADHIATADLATRVIYTAARTPEQSRDEIVAVLRGLDALPPGQQLP